MLLIFGGTPTVERYRGNPAVQAVESYLDGLRRKDLSQVTHEGG